MKNIIISGIQINAASFLFFVFLNPAIKTNIRFKNSNNINKLESELKYQSTKNQRILALDWKGKFAWVKFPTKSFI